MRVRLPPVLVVVTSDGVVRGPGGVVRGALGRSGVRADKYEGDGATPLGLWPMRRLLYRPDRLGAPVTGLPVTAIAPCDGWCDDPTDPRYNQPISLPDSARHERLWRDDGLYDVVVVLGYNDDPVIPGRGSAIFLHVARPDYGPTEGCVALALPDLLALVRACGPGAALDIQAEPARLGTRLEESNPPSGPFDTGDPSQ